MKYYITSDVNGFYDELRTALQASGCFGDVFPHKLVILGDLFDRGSQAKELQAFVLELMERDEIILIKGNHEDLFEEFATVDHGVPYSHHIINGTYKTSLLLTGYSIENSMDNLGFAEAIRETNLFKRIIPSMKPYFETENYIFTHGWIPCIRDWKGCYSYYSAWREASADEWTAARWINGMDAAHQAPAEKLLSMDTGTLLMATANMRAVALNTEMAQTLVLTTAPE